MKRIVNELNNVQKIKIITKAMLISSSIALLSIILGLFIISFIEIYIPLNNFIKGIILFSFVFIGIIISIKRNFKDIINGNIINKRFDIIFQKVNDAILYIDIDGIIKNINEAGLRIYGVEANDLLNKKFWELCIIFEEDIPALIESFSTVINGEEYGPLKFRIKNKKGEVRYLESNSSIISHGETEIVVVIRDITESSIQSIRYEELFYNINDGVIIFKPINYGEDFEIIDFNPAAEAMEMISKREIIGKTLLNSSSTFGKDSIFITTMRKVLTSGESKSFIHEFYDNRNIRTIETYMYKVPTGDIVTLYRDLTDKKRMQDEMLKTQKLESLGVLASGIAHDFNNLLNGIFGNIELAKENFCSNINGCQEKEYIDNALKYYEKASKLTAELLTFSKGGMPKKENISIKEILNTSVEYAIAGSTVITECNYEIEENLIIEADRQQLINAFTNIIINAREAIDDHGIIKINLTEFNKTDNEDIKDLENGKYAKITIEDSGYGISENIILKIFDPFFSTKNGSGLGLSTTYSIIKKHGGKIYVKSKVNEGTIFTIYFPIVYQIKDKCVEILDNDDKIEKIKILVMDDQKFICKLITKIFKDCKVLEAYDGEQAVDLYKKNPDIAVCILDLTIPGSESGEEVLRNLIEIDSEVKAIVASGYSDNSVLGNYEKYGFQGAIAKPFRKKDIIDIVAKVLKK